MTLDGWQMQISGRVTSCASCGHHAVLYQGQRYGGHGLWEDLPGALLCEICLEARFDLQRSQLDVPPPRAWWRVW
jgi:hypothetical protein